MRDIDKKRERERGRERFRQRATAACQRRKLIISPSPPVTLTELKPLDKTCVMFHSQHKRTHSALLSKQNDTKV